MAITKTTSIHTITILPASNSKYSTDDVLSIKYVDTWDDPADSELPLAKSRVENLTRYTSDGNATDISGRDQIIKDIAAALWK